MNIPPLIRKRGVFLSSWAYYSYYRFFSHYGSRVGWEMRIQGSCRLSRLLLKDVHDQKLKEKMQKKIKSWGQLPKTSFKMTI